MSDNKEQQVKTGYKKLLGLLIKVGCNETVAKVVTGAVIGALVSLFFTSCNSITPTQIHTIHSIYHKVVDDKCIFEVENNK